MSFSDGTAVLGNRASRAVIATWAVMALLVLLFLLEAGEVLGVINFAMMPAALASAYAAIGIGYTVAFIASVILVAMWIHRAHANLIEAGIDGLEFTPGWAVGWYFIPFANLVKPLHAMRELWNTSMGQADRYGQDAPSNIGIWWGCWIVGNILSNISTRMSFMGDGGNLQFAALIGAVSSVVTIACAWMLLKLMRDITDAQRYGLRAAEVFG